MAKLQLPGYYKPLDKKGNYEGLIIGKTYYVTVVPDEERHLLIFDEDHNPVPEPVSHAYNYRTFYVYKEEFLEWFEPTHKAFNDKLEDLLK